ncbi:integral membrane protein [Aspergillus uvarum CBS 121591]|uniref:Integral membrane protein n=1 Tax=Aspergillus uvarum CBS 121591 TaxID=1448315 RepID=A0A319CVC4_9EURO|nr:integral membrane protein [Aspergillus uvarum CBS 121591]PYH79568.1 integral membrane protein [Aspergillus uvarum CBS 121591]
MNYKRQKAPALAPALSPEDADLPGGQHLPLYNLTSIRLELLCWPVSLICLVLVLPMSNNLPPISPSVEPAALARHYAAHEDGFRAGVVLTLLSGANYPFYGIGVSNILVRIPGVNPVMVMTQAAAGVVVGACFMFCGIFLAPISFRPDRDPALIQLLSDLGWLFYMLFLPVMYVQDFLITSLIFSDRRPIPLVPRWLAWVNCVLPLGWFGGFGVHFVHSGPFAWNGAISFWLASASYAVQIATNLPVLWIAAGKIPPGGLMTVEGAQSTF